MSDEQPVTGLHNPLTLKQRQVLEALRHEARPMTAYALLAQLHGSGFSAPTQVYRALERLTEHGLVHRLECLNAFVTCAHGGRHGFSAFAICDDCGRIDEFVDDTLGTRLAVLARRSRFALDATTIELRGRCSSCSERLRESTPAAHGSSPPNQAKHLSAKR